MVNLHHNAICDVCGFRYKASELKLRWDKLMVCPDDYELRNAQEFVRAMSNDKAPYRSKALGAYIFLSPNEVQPEDL
jgi:hypothetical protein